MHTESNPQQPATTPNSDDQVEATTTASKAASQPATGKPKPAAAKKPTAEQPARERAAARATGAKTSPAKDRQPAKAAGKTPSAEPAPKGPATGPREGSTMWAILQVLETAAEPLSPKDIYAQIAERKLASGLKGKTPDQSVAAALAVAAKQGRYVERAAPGKFRKLTDERA